ncbi:hypothetical protein FHW69_002681 [Luteibacter sp. Sphag1AF]|uniref:hypothetical protein n=1 Tax=Luteibacter sp. Sphag1AF TaxID=2587031 RepID=UPI00160A24DD|nr:hypothetical protein [Luteibacter sp. Sphag1AF]MBB3228046.1 hypothetical protein [Luteibacter sp. Sphag1AF]
MTRTLVMAIRLYPGSREDEVIARVTEALEIARARAYLTSKPFYLARTDAGHLLLVAEVASVAAMDAMDEDTDFQDAVTRVSRLAEAIPLHGLMDFQGVRVSLETAGHSAP